MKSAPRNGGSPATDQGRTRPASVPGTLGAALSQLIALKGLAHERGDAQLEKTWAEVAGERITGRTVVMGMHRGVLQIAVASSAMLNELAAFHKGRLVAELQAREPRLKLRDIKFRLRGDLAKK